jgi:hypothetical protein
MISITAGPNGHDVVWEELEGGCMDKSKYAGYFFDSLKSKTADHPEWKESVGSKDGSPYRLITMISNLGGMGGALSHSTLVIWVGIQSLPSGLRFRRA